MGRAVFHMVDYQPIAELVNQIPADTWEVLQEIQKRRPAMMLDELLDKRERAPKLPQSRLGAIRPHDQSRGMPEMRPHSASNPS
jgi:hypothetical protein